MFIKNVVNCSLLFLTKLLDSLSFFVKAILTLVYKKLLDCFYPYLWKQGLARIAKILNVVYEEYFEHFILVCVGGL